ncbi:MAG: hypothetical protein Q8K78_04390 [Planctomycetaceae bacterium]|nr:hypothetical protein [Planctomycetaceae bacterium]
MDIPSDFTPSVSRREWTRPKVIGTAVVTFVCGLILGGSDRILNAWNRDSLAYAIKDIEINSAGGLVWNGDADADALCKRMQRAGHERDAMEVLLQLRHHPESMIRQQALLVITVHLGVTCREAITVLANDLRDPTISEVNKNEIRHFLAMIRDIFANHFPAEIKDIQIRPTALPQSADAPR